MRKAWAWSTTSPGDFQSLHCRSLKGARNKANATATVDWGHASYDSVGVAVKSVVSLHLVNEFILIIGFVVLLACVVERFPFFTVFHGYLRIVNDGLSSLSWGSSFHGGSRPPEEVLAASAVSKASARTFIFSAKFVTSQFAEFVVTSCHAHGVWLPTFVFPAASEAVYDR